MFNEMCVKDYNGNIITALKNDWALLTAGNEKNYNTMTVSWGAMGELWSEPCIFCFVRPQRYTYEFMETNDFFTLSFFGGKEKDTLNFCGSKSGREFDKAKETGLTPLTVDQSVSFENAETIFLCRKLAFYDIDPKGFVDKSIEKNYPNNDYHRMYIGKIEKILKRD